MMKDAHLHSGVAHSLSIMPARRGRWAVFFCILVICGSLSGAAILQMGLDIHDTHQLQAHFNSLRAEEIRASAEDQLNHYEAIGLLFANGGMADAAVAVLPGIRGIAVAASSGQMLRYSGTPLDMTALTAELRGPRTVIGTDKNILILYRNSDRVLAVAFNRGQLLSRAMVRDSILLSAAGRVLEGTLHTKNYARIQGHKWPVEIHAATTKISGLVGYPVPVLFIYLALVPLAAGFWLFWVFRREIIWRSQASRIIRTMRTAWLTKHPGPPAKRRP